MRSLNFSISNTCDRVWPCRGRMLVPSSRLTRPRIMIRPGQSVHSSPSPPLPFPSLGAKSLAQLPPVRSRRRSSSGKPAGPRPGGDGPRLMVRSGPLIWTVQMDLKLSLAVFKSASELFEGNACVGSCLTLGPEPTEP